MADAVMVVADVGGTNMRVAAATRNTIEVPVHIATAQEPLVGMRNLLKLVRVVAAERKVEAVTVGFPGLLDEQGALYDTTTLPQWEGVKLTRVLEDALQVPVYVENDAMVAGLGEAHAGAGQGFHVVGYVTVSTGVGGGRIVNGSIDRHPYIIGHQKIGSFALEDLVSGTAVCRRFGCEPAALADVKARKALADALARGLFYAHQHWSSHVLVLGGPLMLGKNPIPIERVRKSFMQYALRNPPPVRLASLGGMSGLRGAHMLAQQRQKQLHACR